MDGHLGFKTILSAILLFRLAASKKRVRNLSRRKYIAVALLTYTCYWLS